MGTATDTVAARVGRETDRPRALVVDDDPDIAHFLVENLSADRFEVVNVDCGRRAMDVLAEFAPDIVLMDEGLPDISGLDVVTHIRGAGPLDGWDARTGIIMLTGRGDPHSIVRGMQRGADDYVTKPFHYDELLERMRATLRRSRGVLAPQRISAGPLTIDRTALSACVGDTQLDLTAKEFGLLVALARDPGRAIPKVELLCEVWGFARSPQRTRTLDSHASRLRIKLEQAGLTGWVRNVWGFGYRLFPLDG